jgi:hypothetical protein
MAEGRVQEKLVQLMTAFSIIAPDLELAMKSMLNSDGSVDSEVRIGNFPDEWRVPDGLPELAAVFSEALAQMGVILPGPEEGGYFITIGSRFGPQDESELEILAMLYKHWRGMFQTAVHPTSAEARDSIQNQVVGIRLILKSLLKTWGVPPATVFIRIIWTPDGVRPERFGGERGGGI